MAIDDFVVMTVALSIIGAACNGAKVTETTWMVPGYTGRERGYRQVVAVHGDTDSACAELGSCWQSTQSAVEAAQDPLDQTWLPERGLLRGLLQETDGGRLAEPLKTLLNPPTISLVAERVLQAIVEFATDPARAVTTVI